MLRFFLALLVVVLLCPAALAQREQGERPEVIVEVDASDAPNLEEWTNNAAKLVKEWHPRFTNLIPTKGYDPPRKIRIKVRKTDRGVAATSGDVIYLSSHWFEDHPDDVGAVIHELVHVIQSYPSGRPGWLTEGIADYLRWAIYEGKPQEWFRRPNEQRGYRQSYRVAAGFLLWLETEPAPGIVTKLNTAMMRGEYSPEMFKEATGKSLDELWMEYVGEA